MKTTGHETAAAMRIDKWLWCARFYKTRAQAAKAVRKGYVRVDDRPVRPAYPIRTSIQINLRSGPYTQQITVLTLAKNRQLSSTAVLLYEENPESKQNRKQIAAQLRAANAMQPATRGRPTKRERRKLPELRKRLY